MKLQADRGSMEPELERLLGGNEHFPGGTSCVQINKEFELAMTKQMHLCNEKWDSGNETHPSESRSLKLQFLDKLSLPILTGTEIKGQDNASIRIALRDGFTGQVVNYGPEASAMVELVVIENDFNGYEGDDWSQEELIVRLSEKVIFTLGIPKYWRKRHEFRLGVKIVDGFHGVKSKRSKDTAFHCWGSPWKLYRKYEILFSIDELSLESVKHNKVRCPDELAKILVIKDRIFELAQKVGQTIIFVRTRNSASMLHKAPTDDRNEVPTIQGALKQEDRDKIVKEFKDGLTQILISTDLLARGFDQSQVNLVVNFDLLVKHDFPSEPDCEVYLHRVGRAGRLGRKGTFSWWYLLCPDK